MHRSTLIHTRREGISGEEIRILSQYVAPYEVRMKRASEKDMGIPESVLLFPGDDGAVQLAHSFREKGLRACVVVGIGGSSLGTKAVYEALKDDTDVDLFFIEGVDPARVRAVMNILRIYEHPEEIVCVVVSKSGKTMETMTGMQVVYRALAERFGERADRQMVVVSDADSPLTKDAKKKGWHTLSLPRYIGGRFSVYTAVGLFPLACAGIDVEKLLDGARAAVGLWKEGEAPSARMRAIELYTAFQSGIRAVALFMFDARLYAFGAWYQALLAESVGKDDKGLLPIVMKGSDDLHALGQYIYDGPVVVDTRVFSTARDEDVVVGDGALVAGDVHDAIRHAFVDTYKKTGRPCTETHIPGGLTPEAIGELMAEQMIMIMILGNLFHVNTFNQPGVEAYKEKAREIMTTRSAKDPRVRKS